MAFSEESEENISANLGKMSDVISAFIPHTCENALPDIYVVKRQGPIL